MPKEFIVLEQYRNDRDNWNTLFIGGWNQARKEASKSELPCIIYEMFDYNEEGEEIKFTNKAFNDSIK